MTTCSNELFIGCPLCILNVVISQKLLQMTSQPKTSCHLTFQKCLLSALVFDADPVGVGIGVKLSCVQDELAKADPGFLERGVHIY